MIAGPCGAVVDKSATHKNESLWVFRYQHQYVHLNKGKRQTIEIDKKNTDNETRLPEKPPENEIDYSAETNRAINRFLLLHKRLQQTIPKKRKIRNFLLLKLLQQEEDLKKLMKEKKT